MERISQSSRSRWLLKLGAAGLLVIGLAFASVAAQAATTNLALGRPYKITILDQNDQFVKLEASYPDTNGKELTDGVKAAKPDFQDPAWVGTLRQGGRDVVIDLGKSATISKVVARFLADKSVGIGAPELVEVSFSSDGVKFSDPIMLQPTFDAEGTVIVPFEGEFNNISARFVKVTWANDVWVFCDEIEVFGN
ncbi:MAG: hypothetical protein IMX00_01385 [Limnochordales bacterium]|nr:hypothetical protein [Limnochordales bacterium]